MLEVKNLVKYFGIKKVVDNVSFKLKSGKILGVLGKNGAGKSTTFRMILNILEPDEGEVLYNGEKIDHNVSDKIGYLPEVGSLIDSYTVYEQCLYYGRMKSMKTEQIKSNMFDLLERFGITEYANMKIKELSKGNKQKIQFIIALLHNPDLIILDEPFSGLDPVSVEYFKKIILELRDQGKTIMFSSHIMSHVEMLCEEVVIIDKGRVILNCNLNEIKQEYANKTLDITGKITDSALRQIAIFGTIEKREGDRYIVNLANKERISDVFKLLYTSEITKFSVLNVSLNDIFLDKVGTNYEE
ncbi:MAG: ATP-binding cassette domain-containing protein [Clostridia bacterium]|nr:ATP-binding cassette domain-containing protein [Clostridia bacterium]